MDIDINKQEAWRILDAITAYKEDYELATAVKNTIKNIEKKMKKVVNGKE